MTAVLENAIIHLNKEIEVAYFKSRLSDVTGTEEESRKGKTPKEETACMSNLGHAINSRMTVICAMCCGRAYGSERSKSYPFVSRWGAIKTISFVYHRRRCIVSAFFYFIDRKGLVTL